MAQFRTILKSLLNVKTKITGVEQIVDRDIVKLIFDVEPYSRDKMRCPHCLKRCRVYDQGSPVSIRLWRHLDAGMLQVWLRYKGPRIICREHGVHMEAVPWAVHGSRFTKDFEQQVTWLSLNMSKKAIATFMKIDWATVGRCISRCRERIEPHPEERLHGLVNIAVDETSYRTGHKYITVIINQDTCSVVWAHEGHGKEVLMKFFDALTPEQLKAIKTVSGDGARWIDACIKERIPHATRCVDSFHVVTWAMEVVDKLRLNFAAERHAQAKAWEQKGCSDISEQIRQEGQKIKATKYAAGKRPEHLTEKQKERRMWLETWCPDLYIAINYKDCLSKLVRRCEADKIQENLNIWQNLARKSRIPEIRALGEKIGRHAQNIINTVRLGFNSARLEAVNNAIKLINRRSYGFRFVENLIDMIYLTFSRNPVQLPKPNFYHLNT